MQVPTVAVLVDVADDRATARVGLDPSTDTHNRALRALGLPRVEDRLRDGAVRAGQVAASGLVDDLLVRGLVVEAEEDVPDDALAGLHGEVACAGAVVAVRVLLRLDLLPPRVVAVHLDLEDLEIGGVGLRLPQQQLRDLVRDLRLLDEPKRRVVPALLEDGATERGEDVEADSPCAQDVRHGHLLRCTVYLSG